MNKQDLKAAILARLEATLASLATAAQETRAGAADHESKGDGKYDTRSTEANYLADGQSRAAAAAAEAVAAVRALEFRPYAAGGQAGLGALVHVALGRERLWFVLVPAGGGVEVLWSGREITLLTPSSPLGAQLMGAAPGRKTREPAGEVLTVE